MNWINLSGVTLESSIVFLLFSIIGLFCFYKEKNFSISFILHLSLMLGAAIVCIQTKNFFFLSMAALMGSIVFSSMNGLFGRGENKFSIRIAYFSTASLLLFSMGVYFIVHHNNIQFLENNLKIIEQVENKYFLGIFLLFLGAALFFFIMPMASYLVLIKNKKSQNVMGFASFAFSIFLFVFSFRFFSYISTQGYFNETFLILSIGSVVSFLFLLLFLGSRSFFAYLPIFFSHSAVLFCFYGLHWSGVSLLLGLFLLTLFYLNENEESEKKKIISSRLSFDKITIFLFSFFIAGGFLLVPSYFFVERFSELLLMGEHTYLVVLNFIFYVSSLFLCSMIYINEGRNNSKRVYLYSFVLFLMFLPVLWNGSIFYGERNVVWSFNIKEVFFSGNQPSETLASLYDQLFYIFFLQLGILIGASFSVILYLKFIKNEAKLFSYLKEYVLFLEEYISKVVTFIPGKCLKLVSFYENTLEKVYFVFLRSTKKFVALFLGFWVYFSEYIFFQFINKQSYFFITFTGNMFSRVQNGHVQWYFFFTVLIFLILVFRLMFIGGVS